ncbi:hypothetical protein QJS10_CPB18g01118 [Acorus calamus]|uniref:Uncharacterized protein n=1 Tax=Acorus calamus TaxID=4465 RepID=A0AAV9CMT8_ACOCL|nr:hypothetical protein QJS10_CPB18g01115 [Acorus calamus]KAK1290231.1 hypothetical protein QJS10_CPB18g01118 [Acorus calamus]
MLRLKLELCKTGNREGHYPIHLASSWGRVDIVRKMVAADKSLARLLRLERVHSPPRRRREQPGRGHLGLAEGGAGAGEGSDVSGRDGASCGGEEPHDPCRDSPDRAP